MNQIFERGVRGFTYDLDNPQHRILYTPDNVSLWEVIRDKNWRRDKSRVDLFPKMFNIKPFGQGPYELDYRLEHATPELVKKVLNELVRRPDFSMNNVEYLV